MDWREHFALALESIRLHRSRSLLTMIGVAVGVAAVILTFAAGRGGQASFNQEMEHSGNYFIVLVKTLTAGNIKENERLGWPDLQRLKQDIPGISSIAPVGADITQARYQDQEKEITLLGTTPDYFPLRRIGIGSGRFFNWQESLSGHQACVLDYETAAKFFNKKNPVGEELTIMGRRYQVVGVTAKEESGWNISLGAYENPVYIPLASWQRLFNNSAFSEIDISPRSREAREQVMKQTRQLLNDLHHTKDRYATMDLQEIENVGRLVGSIFTSIIIAIAAISLFVGGIGVMNIMLVSVTERTREIGIRMALGATPQQILTQFLIEAILICLLSGLVGLVLGIGGAYLLAAVFNWPPQISLWSVLLAVTFSVGVGLFFGLYPAYRAAGMDPVEALRHE